jgi:hypothetical protein
LLSLIINSQLTMSSLPFYGLGMNSPRIISIIWYGSSPPPADFPIYLLLIHNGWQSLIVVSLGAIVGCIITFISINTLGRRSIQMIGFCWLFILFVVTGASFEHLYNIGGTAATVVLYILCQIFFNFGRLFLSSQLKFLTKKSLTYPGPNVTTYIVRAPFYLAYY